MRIGKEIITKTAFITKNQNIDIQKYIDALAEIGIKATKVDTCFYIGVSVSNRNKQRAIEALDSIPFKENEQFGWVDNDNVIHPYGYIPIMYNAVPERFKVDFAWTVYREPFVDDALKNSVPESFKKYVAKLEIILDSEIYTEVNSLENAIGFFVKAPFSEHESMLEKCRLFNTTMGIEPFEEVYYTDKQYDIIKDDEEKRLTK